jgi:hypothetical protein
MDGRARGNGNSYLHPIDHTGDSLVIMSLGMAVCVKLNCRHRLVAVAKTSSGSPCVAAGFGIYNRAKESKAKPVSLTSQTNELVY